MFHHCPIKSKYYSHYYLESIKDRRQKFWDNIERIDRINKKNISVHRYHSSFWSIYNGGYFYPRGDYYYKFNEKPKFDEVEKKTETISVLNNTEESSVNTKNKTELENKVKTMAHEPTQEYFTNWEKSKINFYNSQYYPYRIVYSLPYGCKMIKEDYDILELQDYGFGWKVSKHTLRENGGDLKKTLKQLILENKDKKNKIYEKNFKELINYGYSEHESTHALGIFGNDLKLSLKYLISKEKYD